MADFASYLPLGHPPPSDESGVSPDWNDHLATTLGAIADLLVTLSAEQWEAPSLCARWRVRDVAGHIVWRLGSSNRELVTGIARAWVGHFINPSRAIDVLSRRAGRAEPAELVAGIRRIALEKAAGRGRSGITELTEAVVHGFDLAHPLDLTLPISPIASGAVALRQRLIAPGGIKAVLRVRTLAATDAGWRLGRGPELPGTAEDHILFLFGRRGLPLARG